MHKMKKFRFSMFIEGRPVEAAYYPVFHFVNGVNCQLWPLYILADGRLIFGGEVHSLSSFTKLVEDELVVTVLPDDQRTYVPEVTSFIATNVTNIVSDDDFLREIPDIVRDLNGQPTTLDRCRDAWQEYLANPSDVRREQLKAAYEEVPRHNRLWLGGFEEKDIPIRKVIYGDQWQKDDYEDDATQD